MSKTFTAKEVAAHKDVEQGLYIIIDNGVYGLAGTFASARTPGAHRHRIAQPPHMHMHAVARETSSLTRRPIDRFRGRAPRRLQDSQKSGRQGCQQAVLEGQFSFGRTLERACLRAKNVWGCEDAGADCGVQYHNEGILKKYEGKLKVGEVREEAKL